MNVAAAVSLVCSVLTYSFGMFVLFHMPRTKSGRLFFAFCVLSALLAFSEFGYRSADTVAEARVWAAVGIAWPFSFSLFLHFVFALTREQLIPRRPWILAVLYGPPILALVSFTTPFPLTRVPTAAPWGFTYRYESPVALAVVLFWGVALAIVGLVLVVADRARSREPAQRLQRKYLIIGLAVFIVAGLSEGWIGHVLNRPVPELSSILLTLAAAIISFGLWRCRMLTRAPGNVAETIIDTISDLLVLSAPDNTIRQANQALVNHLGYTRSELVGRDVSELLANPEAVWSKLGRDDASGPVAVADYDTALTTKDGAAVPVSLSVSTIYAPDGEVRGRVFVARDNTERQMANDRLAFIAYHDPLTGLLNRKSFYETLEKVMYESHRREGARGALMYVDLDYFKEVNDAYGHDLGDRLLGNVARRLSGSIRKSDYAFRMGGDEFTVVLQNVTEDTDVGYVARKIVENICQPFDLGGLAAHVGVSIGIAVFPRDADEVDQLVKKADEALYEAKKERNSFRFYSQDLQTRTEHQIEVVNRLRRALDEDGLQVAFHPVVNERNEILGAEALVRWQMSGEEIILPRGFLPAAEKSGLIVSIGALVVRRACEFLSECMVRGRQDLFVSVNLSARQLIDHDLLPLIQSVVAEAGVPHHNLRFEIPEANLADQNGRAWNTVGLLRQAGFPCILDDFGREYTSLNQLSELPVDMVKIDRYFVSRVPRDVRVSSMVRSLTTLLRGLGYSVLAEGVETEPQLRYLREAQCTMYQGFLFYEPLSSPQFFDVLDKLPHSANIYEPPH
jgi:diguanylate cyclase (GGDEF)-like protein/PAS domain S-box-containing protein